MIQYKCDLCGEVKNVNNINIFEKFPRLVRSIASFESDSKNRFVNIPGIAETHLCNNCCNKIAEMFPDAVNGGV